MKQHYRLLLGFSLGVLGGLLGYYFLPAGEHAFMAKVTELFTFVGATFLRLIFMVVVPLILSALMLSRAAESSSFHPLPDDLTPVAIVELSDEVRDDAADVI